MKGFKGQTSFLAMLIGAVSVEASGAPISLLPGDKMTIDGTSPVYEFNLSGSLLKVLPGGETGRIVANENSQVSIDGGTVTSIGEPAIALYNSSAVINNSTIIATSAPANPSASAFAIRLSGFSQASSALVSNSFVSGIDRGINVTNKASLVLLNTTVEGHAGSSGSGFVTGGAGVVVVGSTAAFTQDTQVSGDRNGAILWADKDLTPATLVIDHSSVTGKQGSALIITRTDPAGQDAYVDINNGSTLSGGNGVILSVENGAAGHVRVNDSQLSGDIVVNEGSTADLDLSNRASLTGRITNVTELTIDNTSRWSMQGDSTAGSLALQGGTVDLRGAGAEFGRLTLGQLTGAGTFVLATDLSAGSGDFLDVTGNGTGNHQLWVENTGAEPIAGDAPQRVVHVAEGDAQFSLIGGKVDFGTFAYQLEQNEVENGTDWSLVQTGELSESSRSVIGLFSAAPTVWYGESATLRSRMGELRNGSRQGGGWVRSYGNKYNMSAAGGVAYRQTQHGISFGADGPVPGSNGQWLMGLMGGYSESDLDLKQGTSGNVDSYYLGAYSTWLADDGFYVDALIKANRFKNSSQVRMSDGEKAEGKYNNVGVGASVEVGKHIKLQDEWFIEPFAQASALWVSGESYQLDNGMSASSNKADSLLGKMGTHVGRTFALDDGGFVQPYVKVAAAHEFVTSNRVDINDNRFTNDLSGSRIELGTGVAAQLTEVLQVHADFDYMNGRNIEQPWGMNVGLRYNW